MAHIPEISERVGQLSRASTTVEAAATDGNAQRAQRNLIDVKRLAARLGELHYCERHALVPDRPSRYLDPERTLEMELGGALDDPADRLASRAAAQDVELEEPARGGWVQLDDDERGTVLEALAQEREAIEEAGGGPAFVERLIAKLGGEPTAPPTGVDVSAATSEADAAADRATRITMLRCAMTDEALVDVWLDSDSDDPGALMGQPTLTAKVAWLNDRQVRLVGMDGRDELRDETGKAVRGDLARTVDLDSIAAVERAS